MPIISINARIIASNNNINICGESPKNVNMCVAARDKLYLLLKNNSSEESPIHNVELPSWVHEIIILPCDRGTTKISGCGIYKTHLINVSKNANKDNQYGFDDEWLAIIIVEKDSFVDEVYISDYFSKDSIKEVTPSPSEIMLY